MAHDTLVNGVLGELELTACNFLANVIDDCHEMTLYLKHISPTQYSGVSCTVRGRTPALSRAQWLERRRSGSYWASAPAPCWAGRTSWGRSLPSKDGNELN